MFLETCNYLHAASQDGLLAFPFSNCDLSLMAVIDLDDWQDSEILTDSERQEVRKLDRLECFFSVIAAA